MSKLLVANWVSTWQEDIRHSGPSNIYSVCLPSLASSWQHFPEFWSFLCHNFSQQPIIRRIPLGGVGCAVAWINFLSTWFDVDLFLKILLTINKQSFLAAKGIRWIQINEFPEVKTRPAGPNLQASKLQGVTTSQHKVRRTGNIWWIKLLAVGLLGKNSTGDKIYVSTYFGHMSVRRLVCCAIFHQLFFYVEME